MIVDSDNNTKLSILISQFGSININRFMAAMRNQFPGMQPEQMTETLYERAEAGQPMVTCHGCKFLTMDISSTRKCINSNWAGDSYSIEENCPCNGISYTRNKG